MTANAIIFDKVTKSFGTVRAVDQVSLAFPHGALVTLLGPSGCGKTTTLRLIAGLELPNAGSIMIEGRDVTRLAAAERRLAPPGRKRHFPAHSYAETTHRIGTSY